MEIEHLPKAGIGVTNRKFFEQPAVRQRNDRTASGHSRHRFRGLKTVQAFLHHSVRHGGRVAVLIVTRVRPYPQDIKHPVPVRLRAETDQSDLKLENHHQYHRN